LAGVGSPGIDLNNKKGRRAFWPVPQFEVAQNSLDDGGAVDQAVPRPGYRPSRPGFILERPRGLWTRSHSKYEVLPASRPRTPDGVCGVAIIEPERRLTAATNCPNREVLRKPRRFAFVYFVYFVVSYPLRKRGQKRKCAAGSGLVLRMRLTTAAEIAKFLAC
jgi:hypothetical protein